MAKDKEVPATPEALADRRFGHPPLVKESEYWKQRVAAELAFEAPMVGGGHAPPSFHAASEIQLRKDRNSFNTSGSQEKAPATPNLRASWRQEQAPVAARTFMAGLLDGDQIPQVRHVAYVSPYPGANDTATSYGTGRMDNSLSKLVDVKSKLVTENNVNDKVKEYQMHRENPTHGNKAWDKIHTKGAVDIKGATLQFQVPGKEIENGMNQPIEGKRIKDMKHWNGTEFSSFFTLDNQLEERIKKV